MNIVLVIFVLSVVALTVLVEDANAAAAATVCPKKGSIMEGMKYHSNEVCNRDAYNMLKANVGRYESIQTYRKMGGISTIPNQKTVTCPVNGGRVNMKDAHTPNVGFDTVWIVENHASTPVVVSFLNEEGIEVSALNPKISPATADPNAVLIPNAWMAVYAFEGHEFVVREVLKSGITGNVLLQHRAGLIPIGANFNMVTSCDPSLDVEPMIDETTTSPVFQRTPTQINRPCNTIDVGFRNVASCPLHGYYVSGEGDQCTEQFKLHLGVESTMTTDFLTDWTSATKYEGTFVGHTFHFRLASNPTILVDTVTLQPVYVTDCPVSSATAVVSEGHRENILTHVGNAEFSNTTDTASNGGIYDALFYPTNATAGVVSSSQQAEKPMLLKII